MNHTSGNLALQDFQATTPAPFLVLVEKPAPVCPSALREAKQTFSQAGRTFEALRYDNDLRIFQDLESGATYHLRVITEQIGSMVFTVSLCNGKVVSSQEYIVYPRYAGTGRYLNNAEQATRGAYDHLQSLVLSGKA